VWLRGDHTSCILHDLEDLRREERHLLQVVRRTVAIRDPLAELLHPQPGVCVVLIDAPEGLPFPPDARLREMREGIEFLGQRLGIPLHMRDYRRQIRG
jgi:hypothetical protein